jgi:ankyrin repeat protein
LNFFSFYFVGILTLLVQHHADVNILFQNSLPPLILAVYLQHKNIVELLIRLGTDPNLVDTNTGRSALHYAAYFHDNTTIFHLLLSSTVHQIIDINVQDNQQLSILDYARANIHHSTDIVDLLLQLSVFDPNRGETSIEHIDIERPNIKIFQSSNELSSLEKQENKSKKKNRSETKSK